MQMWGRPPWPPLSLDPTPNHSQLAASCLIDTHFYPFLFDKYTLILLLFCFFFNNTDT